jgi:hypothetical protein
MRKKEMPASTAEPGPSPKLRKNARPKRLEGEYGEMRGDGNLRG